MRQPYIRTIIVAAVALVVGASIAAAEPKKQKTKENPVPTRLEGYWITNGADRHPDLRRIRHVGSCSAVAH
jgi:hypothetical protein